MRYGMVHLAILAACLLAVPAQGQVLGWSEGGLEVSVLGTSDTLTYYPNYTPPGASTSPEKVSGSGQLYGVGMRYVSGGDGLSFGGGFDLGIGPQFPNQMDYSPAARADFATVRSWMDFSYPLVLPELDDVGAFGLKLVARFGLCLSAVDAAWAYASPRLHGVVVIAPHTLALEVEGGLMWAGTRGLKADEYYFQGGDTGKMEYGESMDIGLDARAALLGPELNDSGTVPFLALGWLKHSFTDDAGDQRALAVEWTVWAGIRL